ncbi:DUF4920 domain-containing protein [Rapidithrix thailandica]|uniref:DUF4920 domain-containing protein n=1 Tax=Rapidithrix thailandica TaxID=413964 RepID=A0AAW9S1D1_9BACT
MKKIILVVLAGLTFTACEKKPETQTTATGQTPDQELAQVEHKTYGETIEISNAMSLDQMEEKLQTIDSLEATVSGKVLEVCKVKGCWMKLQSSDNNIVRVTFKDYGFFVDQDIVGKEATVKGMAKKQVISRETLQHYAEDAGKSKEEIAAIQEDKVELAFVAEGVVVK